MPTFSNAVNNLYVFYLIGYIVDNIYTSGHKVYIIYDRDGFQKLGWFFSDLDQSAERL